MTEARASGDHFSGVSAGYATFRPRYPRELFDFIVSLAPRLECAWDCGAGNGQATAQLAERFERVIGTDVSAEQLAHAPRDGRIQWIVAAAEAVPIESRSVDLITVAQALHWFDHERFHAEVRRVASPNAVIAAWTYTAAKMEGALGRVIRRYIFEDVREYWPAERRYVDEEYRTVPFPFERIAAPDFSLVYEWTPDQVAGYLRTMSATARCAAARGVDPVAPVEAELRRLWGTESTRRISWKIPVIAGRVT